MVGGLTTNAAARAAIVAKQPEAVETVLASSPKDFQAVMAAIEDSYIFEPVAFKVGELASESGQSIVQLLRSLDLVAAMRADSPAFFSMLLAFGSPLLTRGPTDRNPHRRLGLCQDLLARQARGSRPGGDASVLWTVLPGRQGHSRW